MLERKIRVVNGMTGEESLIRVQPGATPKDVLSELGMRSHRLARVRDRHELPLNGDMVRLTAPNERLFAFSPIEVGGA